MDVEVEKPRRGRPRKVVRLPLKVEAIFGREPLPAPPLTLQDEMNELLAILEVGASLDVPRPLESMKTCVYIYRKKSGGKHLLRELKPGWTRIWRVA